MRRANVAGRGIPALILAIALGTICSCRVQPIPEDASVRTLGWLENRYPRLSDSVVDDLLKRVTQRLSETLGVPAIQDQLTHSQLTWHVTVLNLPEANAFSLGSGHLVLSRQLLRNLHSEAELASILSHEMSHQLLAHHMLGTSADPAPAVSFTAAQEVEADRLGLQLLHHARYDPLAAVSALALYYRSHRETVDSSFDRRVALLSQQVAALRRDLPATVNSREFNRAKLRLTAWVN